MAKPLRTDRSNAPRVWRKENDIAKPVKDGKLPSQLIRQTSECDLGANAPVSRIQGPYTPSRKRPDEFNSDGERELALQFDIQNMSSYMNHLFCAASVLSAASP